jgi:hypothetical protein
MSIQSVLSNTNVVGSTQVKDTYTRYLIETGGTSVSAIKLESVVSIHLTTVGVNDVDIYVKRIRVYFYMTDQDDDLSVRSLLPAIGSLRLSSIPAPGSTTSASNSIVVSIASPDYRNSTVIDYPFAVSIPTDADEMYFEISLMTPFKVDTYEDGNGRTVGKINMSFSLNTSIISDVDQRYFYVRGTEPNIKGSGAVVFNPGMSVDFTLVPTSGTDQLQGIIDVIQRLITIGEDAGVYDDTVYGPYILQIIDSLADIRSAVHENDGGQLEQIQQSLECIKKTLDCSAV